MNKWGLLLCLSLLSFPNQAQVDIPIGTWRMHFSYRDAHSIAAMETGVYCAGLNTLFLVDLQDNSLNRIGKIDGLAETNISTIGYYDPLNILVIAYHNGNIDLLVNQEIVNINTITNSPTGTSKAILHITFYQGLAFLSTDFGVVVLDLVKEEIKEAYTNIGTNGEVVKVKSGAVSSDTLFLATSEGVIAGSLDPGNNLQDFKNWKRFSVADGLPNLPASAIGSNSNLMLAAFDLEGIYLYQSPNWLQLPVDLESQILNISGSSPMIITTAEKLVSVDDDLNIEELQHELFPKPQSAISDAGTLWIADSVNGLVKSTAGFLNSLFPTGPFSDSVFNLVYSGGMILALPPGYDALGDPLRTSQGFFTFMEGDWTSYNSSGLSQTEVFPPIKDLVDVCFNKNNSRFYFASYGEGIIEWEPGVGITVLDESTAGSTLENIVPGGRNVFVNSLLADEDGQIWACNYGNSNPVHQYNPENGSWSSYQADFNAGKYPLDILLTTDGDFWLRLDPNKGGGIMVLNPETTQQRHLNDIPDQGGLPSSNVNALVMDNNGQIWVATDNGVSHFPFPFDVLENPVANATPVIIDGRPLLRGEVVTSIAVDGGNRKWVGTENGIWLFTARGDSVIASFNEKNSPLPSNKVIDVEINHKNGEVFIMTEAGMLSYRGSATEGGPIPEQVKIFPNPVTRDYSGVVGISGLSENAIVKVADVTGKLVREFQAAGGTAVWDIKDYQNQRVQSGVYLVFSSSPDGNQTFVGKIAIIN